MHKDMLLASLRAALEDGTVTPDEVRPLLGDAKTKKRIGLQQTLYIVGGLIFILGIVLFIAEIWSDISQSMQAVLTLGLASALYSGGFVLYRNKASRAFARVLFILFGLLLPLGLAVFFNLIGFAEDGAFLGTLISALALVPFVVSWNRMRELTFFYFSLTTASALFMFATEWFVDIERVHQDDWVIWRLFLVGVAWVVVSVWAKREDIPETLVSAVGFLTALGSLFYFITEYGLLWQLLYPFVLAGVYWFAIQMQDRRAILFGALYTAGYVSYISAEYFEDALGWPLTIAVAGLLIMGVGYGSISLSKKLKRQTSAE